MLRLQAVQWKYEQNTHRHISQKDNSNGHKANGNIFHHVIGEITTKPNEIPKHSIIMATIVSVGKDVEQSKSHTFLIWVSSGTITLKN